MLRYLKRQFGRLLSYLKYGDPDFKANLEMWCAEHAKQTKERIAESRRRGEEDYEQRQIESYVEGKYDHQPCYFILDGGTKIRLGYTWGPPRGTLLWKVGNKLFRPKNPEDATDGMPENAELTYLPNSRRNDKLLVQEKDNRIYFGCDCGEWGDFETKDDLLLFLKKEYPGRKY